MRVRSCNSILKKYIFGYTIMVMTMCIFLIFGVITSMYMTRQYSLLTKKLSDITLLEKSIDVFCMDVEKTAAYFLTEGIDDYSNAKDDVLKSKELIKAESEGRYSRSTEDLLATLSTFLEESDSLMQDIQQYINSDDTSIQSLIFNEKYQRIKELRSYVDKCIQNEYAYDLELMTLKQMDIKRIQNILYVLWGILLVISIIASLGYVDHVYKDMRKSISELERGIEEFQDDVYNVKPIIINSGDEFEQLSKTFNYMTYLISKQMSMISENAKIKERLVKAENENLKMYSELQKNHLKFLQSRINPHFLFNTLNMIASMAMLENAEKSAEMMITTAAFLRYNLDNVSKQVTLKQEISNLEDYLTIQRCRYGARFSFECQMGTGSENQLMPAMILQPMVENSIQHGIGMMAAGGKVLVSTKKEKDKVILSVEDNGVGMTEDQIHSLKETMHSFQNQSSHIGLKNIFQRLQLFYDNKAEIELFEMEPGLKIIISVPYSDNAEDG